LFGDAAGIVDSVQGGNDTLTVNNFGSGSLIYLFGDTNEMSGNGKGGNDILTTNNSGSDSVTYLFGDAGGMHDSAQGGNDTLNGGAGNDSLYGDAAYYSTPTFPGSITGGTDILTGGAGNDQLWGGPNDDKFVFGLGSGNDTINDFNQGNLVVGSTATEHDVINVHAYGFSGWSVLQANISDDLVSGNAVIHLSATNSMTLVGVHTVDLQETDFII